VPEHSGNISTDLSKKLQKILIWRDRGCRELLITQTRTFRGNDRGNKAVGEMKGQGERERVDLAGG